MDNDDKESIISANTMIRKSYNDKVIKEKERMLSVLKNDFMMKNDNELMNLENDIHQLIDKMIKEENVINEGYYHHHHQQPSSLSSISSSSSYSSLSSSNKSVNNNNSGISNNHHSNNGNSNSRNYNVMNSTSAHARLDDYGGRID